MRFAHIQEAIRAARLDVELAERNLQDAQRALQQADRVREVYERLLRGGAQPHPVKDLPSPDVQLSPRLPRR